ncbi:EAL and HDOD domain-containing protein [Thermodesulfobacteriota bacterium]
MEVYVARQPIFNKEKKIYGYELLFRDSMSNYFPDIDGNTATSKVLSNSFFTIGIEDIIGKGLAFINFTEDLLINRLPLLFPREKMVIEVLEDVEPKEDVIAACREITNQGYTLALDDFFYQSALEPLISLSDIIKFDFMATDLEEIKKYVDRLSNNHIKFLAEKVETHEEFKTALDMGFEFFQGYFFSKPEILTGKDISSAQMNLLEIIAEANKADFKFKELEKIISRDVAISYKLLRYMNSAYLKRVNEISSIKQAIVLLGEKGVRQFISLIAMSQLSENKPDELIRASIIRAKFCEMLGEMGSSQANPSELFTIGLFSLLDAILDHPMPELVEKLPLSESIKMALVKGEGTLVSYLRLAESYEKGDWEGVTEYVSELGLDETDLPKHYGEALSWADSLSTI